MLKKLYYFVLNTLLVASYLKEHLSFKYSLLNTEKTQGKLLLKILQKNKDTIYGKRYEFCSINSIEDFQNKVPITNYDSYKKYINLIRAGKNSILTRDNVIMLEPTSGSTASSKFIPYTKSLKKEFQNGIGPWIFDLYTKRKQLLIGSAYWSITPIIKNKSPPKSRIPIGFEEDTEYFGTFQKYLIDELLAVPKEVKKISDIESFKYVTLLFLLKNKNLTFVSVWNPTYTSFLLEKSKEWLNDLIKDIEVGQIDSIKLYPKLKRELSRKLKKDEKRARELRDIFSKWKSSKYSIQQLYKDIWPNLALISCWTSGNSANYVSEIKKYFPNIEIQGKGLIATEGFISFPLFDLKFSILSINSHFFEFVDKENGNIKLTNELELNKIYSVIITTSGGLYRYRLNDLIKVKGFHRKVPLIEFVGKEDHISDLFGEKLNEEHISRIFQKLFKKYKIKSKFFMLAPENLDKKVSYVIHLELQIKINKYKLIKFQKDFEKELRKNYHYDHCRKINQLQHSRLFIIRRNASRIILQAISERGQRLGNVKTPVLYKNFNWSKKFQGRYVGE